MPARTTCRARSPTATNSRICAFASPSVQLGSGSAIPGLLPSAHNSPGHVRPVTTCPNAGVQECSHRMLHLDLLVLSSSRCLPLLGRVQGPACGSCPSRPRHGAQALAAVGLSANLFISALASGCCTVPLPPNRQARRDRARNTVRSIVLPWTGLANAWCPCGARRTGIPLPVRPGRQGRPELAGCLLRWDVRPYRGLERSGRVAGSCQQP